MLGKLYQRVLIAVQVLIAWLVVTCAVIGALTVYAKSKTLLTTLANGSMEDKCFAQITQRK